MNADNKPNVTPEVIDLLDKLLRYDHYERFTAAEALSHAYFSECQIRGVHLVPRLT